MRWARERDWDNLASLGSVVLELALVAFAIAAVTRVGGREPLVGDPSGR